MYVYVVYDEGSQTDGYTLIHGVFSTYEKAEDFVKTIPEEYSGGEELAENVQIDKMKVN